MSREVSASNDGCLTGPQLANDCAAKPLAGITIPEVPGDPR
ncbi:MAG: hypothetical protein WAL34_00475 [Acidobacteriaceae bacterium]